MKARIQYKVALLFAILVGIPLAYAQNGGYPTNPTFNTVNVNTYNLTPTEGGTLLASPVSTGYAAAYMNGTVVVTGNTLAHANQTITNTQLYFQGGSAEIVTDVGGAGTDAKIWSFYGGTDGTYRWRLENDALNAVVDELVLTRTGAASATFKVQPEGAGNETVTYSKNSTGVFLENIAALNSAGISNGVAIYAGTNSSDVAFQVLNVGNTATYLKVRGDGEMFYGSGTTLVPHQAWAQIVQGSSTCSIGSGASSGNVTSCAFVATGESTIVFSGFTNPPQCNGNAISGTFGALNVNFSSISATGATMWASNGGTATNLTVNMTCTGY